MGLGFLRFTCYTNFDLILQIFIFVSVQKRVIGCVVADQIEKVGSCYQVYVMISLYACNNHDVHYIGL